MTVAVVTVTAEGCDIYTPYNSSFVAALKTQIPWRARHWNADDRCWSVDEPFVDAAIDVVRSYFPAVGVTDQRRSQPSSNTQASWPRVLYNAIPARLRHAVFRSLARVLHPDANGDGRAMQELNDGWPQDGRP